MMFRYNSGFSNDAVPRHRRLVLLPPLAFLTLVLCLLVAPRPVVAMTVSDPRCEYLSDPEGIDVKEPRLSWILDSNERGQFQTAYQIIVASSEEKLRRNDGDLWDSGRTPSRESIHIRYAGKPLGSFTKCFWKLRAWDQDDKATRWSTPAFWSMGPLQATDWKARWIGKVGEPTTNYLSGADWIWLPDTDSADPKPDTVCFRRTVVIPNGRKIKRILFQYTGDSECRGWVNGRDLGTRDDHTFIKFNDVTHRLVPGTNVIALRGRNVDGKALRAGVVGLLEIEFAEGDPITIGTDEGWKAAPREESGWQEPGFDDSNWKSAGRLAPVGSKPWGKVRVAENRRLPARYLRREFQIDKKFSRATVSFSGLGLSELYLNGEKVGDHVLSPAMSEYPKRVFYVTFDVTDQLRRGRNALGAILGNGRFYAPRSRVYAGMPSYGFPKLLLHLRLENTDGTVSEITSDESWRLTEDGPILANNEYDGEEYDARKEFDDWSEPGFDDSNWHGVDVMPVPTGRLSAQMIEPIRVTQTLKPVAVTEPQPGVFIFDLGQNMVGWCRLKVRGPAGARVFLRHAETLKADGTLFLDNIRGARAMDIYTLKGGRAETWEPRFTYHGFRYVEVTGYPGRPGLDAIRGRVVHDDLRTTGEFTCSNPLLNRIYRNVVWGTRGNYRSIPTDCPQRDEREGWLGDRGEVARGEMYFFDTAAFYSKWVQDMEDAQRENGNVPNIAPAHWPNYSINVTWPSSTILIPNSLHRQYADRAILEHHYDSARRWIDFMLPFMVDGLIPRDTYGDWCVPPDDPAQIHTTDPDRITDKTLLASSYFYHDLRLMRRFAEILGEGADAARFAGLAEALKSAFNKKFLNRELGQYDNGTQTSCVLPLYFGMVPDDMRERVFQHLVEKITRETKGHIGTGLVGGQFLNRVLSDNGRADLAYTMAVREDYPGWGYMVEHGATTIWELWNGDTADPSMNSGNHVMLIGDLVIWLYEYLAGIRPDADRPGFKHITMRPHPVGDLRFVKAAHRSPHGWIRSEWRKDGGTLDWKIEVPANTTATLHVPASDVSTVSEGRRPATKARGVKFVKMENGCAVFSVGSGRYHFESRGFLP